MFIVVLLEDDVVLNMVVSLAEVVKLVFNAVVMLVVAVEVVKLLVDLVVVFCVIDFGTAVVIIGFVELSFMEVGVVLDLLVVAVVFEKGRVCVIEVVVTKFFELFLVTVDELDIFVDARVLFVVKPNEESFALVDVITVIIGVVFEAVVVVTVKVEVAVVVTLVVVIKVEV